jgi:serine protease Do
MSGGPVFNRNGEVIGVVSRSIQPDEGQELGTGWAILLGALPVLERWVPTLDKDNPRYRRCWVAYRPSPWELGGASNTEKKAMAIAAEKGEAFQISFGAWEIGTNNFIISSSS